MANSTLTFPDLIAQYEAHEAAFPGFDDAALEAQWNERATLLEYMIAQTRPVSVECVASALDFALDHPERGIAGNVLRHCAALLKVA